MRCPRLGTGSAPGDGPFAPPPSQDHLFFGVGSYQMIPPPETGETSWPMCVGTQTQIHAQRFRCVPQSNSKDKAEFQAQPSMQAR
jgi:hypothetical protein